MHQSLSASSVVFWMTSGSPCVEDGHGIVRHLAGNSPTRPRCWSMRCVTSRSHDYRFLNR